MGVDESLYGFSECIASNGISWPLSVGVRGNNARDAFCPLEYGSKFFLQSGRNLPAHPTKNLISITKGLGEEGATVAIAV